MLYYWNALFAGRWGCYYCSFLISLKIETFPSNPSHGFIRVQDWYLIFVSQFASTYDSSFAPFWVQLLQLLLEGRKLQILLGYSISMIFFLSVTYQTCTLLKCCSELRNEKVHSTKMQQMYIEILQVLFNKG